MRPFPETVAPEFSGLLDVASGLSLYSPWCESESPRDDDLISLAVSWLTFIFLIL